MRTNKHQLADRLRWHPKSWIRYPQEPKIAIPPDDPRHAVGAAANQFIARLLEQSRQ